MNYDSDTNEHADSTSGNSATASTVTRRQKLKPGRPPLYVFTKPDDELSKNERRLKDSVMKRRIRQNRSYHRKKLLQQTSLSTPGQNPCNMTTLSLPSDSNVPASTDLPNTSISNSPLPTPSPLSISGLTPGGGALLAVMRNSPPLNNSIECGDKNGALTSSITAVSSLVPSISSSPEWGDLGSLTNSSSALADPLQCEYSTTQLTGDSDATGNFLSRGYASIDEDRPDKDVVDLTVSTTTKSIPMEPLTSILCTDLSARIASLPAASASVISSLLIFPSSFSAVSAAAVIEGTSCHSNSSKSPSNIDAFTSNVLIPLSKTGILEAVQGRYFVSEAARRLLPTAENSVFTAQSMTRFVDHFCARLRKFDPETLSTHGNARLSAMMFYVQESRNVETAIQFSSQLSGFIGAFEILQHAATVMRYCVAPEERVSMLSRVLRAAEGNYCHTENSMSLRDCERVKIIGEARVRLALGEAYLDMLVIDKAAEHVTHAVSMLATASREPNICVSSSVLALVLLAELRISQRAFAEGSRLLAEALQALKVAGLQKSTFSVCCLLNLGTVYNNVGETEKALQAVQKGLNILSGLGFDYMPIYADGLRSLGIVHLKAGDTDYAQKIFSSALDIIEKWRERDAPMQHCKYLDIFLTELLAQTYKTQGHENAAGLLLQQARQWRIERKLVDVNDQSNLNSLPHVPPVLNNSSRWLFTRHLY